MACVVELEEILEEKSDAILKELLRQMLVAFGVNADDARDGALVVAEDSLDFVRSLAEGAQHGHFCYGTIGQAFLRLRLEDGLGDGGTLTLLSLTRNRC